MGSVAGRSWIPAETSGPTFAGAGDPAADRAGSGRESAEVVPVAPGGDVEDGPAPGVLRPTIATPAMMKITPTRTAMGQRERPATGTGGTLKVTTAGYRRWPKPARLPVRRRERRRGDIGPRCPPAGAAR